MDLHNKNVLVIGLATTGIPLVKVLDDLGASIIVNDARNETQLEETLKKLGEFNVKYYLGKHPINIDELGHIDLVVVSPGVPLDIPFIKQIKQKGVKLIGEIELAYRLMKGQIIAITGTNGKTTTTALTGEIFKNANKNVFILGNIGTAAISKALDTKDDDFIILEISSFQLESCDKFHPNVATVLNITPDHLNRHYTMNNYIDIKFSIFQNQTITDYSIINYDDLDCRNKIDRTNGKVIYFSRRQELEEGIFVKDDYIVIKKNGIERKVINTADILLPGKHNLENALAATAMAYIYGIDIEIISNSLKCFSGVDHRLQVIANINGVEFINDSKATNVESANKAIEAVEKPILLIAGGMDKNTDFTSFIRVIKKKVKVLYVFGEVSKKLFETAKLNGFDSVHIVKDLDEGVSKAYNQASEGEAILLSPACASWDMYTNFEERGNHFKRIVSKLKG
ncbi:UDP-N-acetylmuramoyl-L-alanine--D-glutamate ligase [Serpentinicella sp. ANB-PHB4]|uniref:UDP-N-acetylmuramoyl-L-alanine--D-glutamate ligase n=1 Tax=Serpentinicella sp. ANB-PHB4 TaxID=3074076 RepID=UPI00285E5BA2|nr:UDP-N-acetylmuramoyl-L-alanine--D-glutamate ligase [Serpentinicella sp. ANB-PHB4]MDR5658030.1 UDP-N-acetylmuramoyl-L-alanine--D-glutamate ligase [Serpentinicella sp. ANB-PHB4]